MTSFELAEEMGVKESYLKKHWNEIVRSYARRDVILVKAGRGSDARYGIKWPSDKDVRFEPKEDEYFYG